MAKKEEHKHELLENPDALKHSLEGAEFWFEKNSKLVLGVGIAALLVVAGYFGFNYYKTNQNE